MVAGTRGNVVKLEFSGLSVTSAVPVKVAAPVNYTGGPFWDPFSLAVRSVQAVDMNGDGYLDIFLAPSYTGFAAPGLHPVVLLNDGSGRFTDGTASVFGAGLPQIGAPNNVFIQQFTTDGRLGMFIVDQGLETHLADGSPDWQNAWKAPLQFWLQDAHGVFRDMSANIDINPAAFNHISSLADVNGDGNLDVVVTRLGGPTVEGSGTAFYLGDGQGKFNFSTAGLPQEVRYMPNAQRDWGGGVDYQFSGTNTVADLDGDGRADLVTASYTGGDQVSGDRTIRVFHQDDKGQFIEAFEAVQPAAVAAMGAMGASAIVAGDLDGDGLPDLVVGWEGAQGGMIEILKNLGNDRYQDVTLDWLGSYLHRMANTRDEVDGWNNPAAALRLEDVNRDGVLDLVLRQHGSSGTQLAAGSSGAAFVYLNDGSGHLSVARPAAAAGPLTVAQIDAMSGLDDHQLGIPLQFDTTNSGHNDFVFISTGAGLDLSTLPANVTSLHVTTMFGAAPGTIHRAGDTGASLWGSAASGSFYGGKGADDLHGGGADDSFHGLAGRDRIDGGAGLDTLVLAGARTAYVLSADGRGGAVLVDAANAGNRAELTSVERLRFSDGVIALDVDGNAGQVYRLYQAAFDREPDLGGLGFWIAAMDRGVSLEEVARAFTQSPEFFTAYGASPAAPDIVGALYANILHRAPDPDGFDFWVDKFGSGAISLDQLLTAFSESPENQAALVGVIGNGIVYTPGY